MNEVVKKVTLTLNLYLSKKYFWTYRFITLKQDKTKKILDLKCLFKKLI